jgi:hypothetical protein
VNHAREVELLEDAAQTLTRFPELNAVTFLLAWANALKNEDRP